MKNCSGDHELWGRASSIELWAQRNLEIQRNVRTKTVQRKSHRSVLEHDENEIRDAGRSQMMKVLYLCGEIHI